MQLPMKLTDKSGAGYASFTVEGAERGIYEYVDHNPYINTHARSHSHDYNPSQEFEKEVFTPAQKTAIVYHGLQKVSSDTKSPSPRHRHHHHHHHHSLVSAIIAGVWPLHGCKQAFLGFERRSSSEEGFGCVCFTHPRCRPWSLQWSNWVLENSLQLCIDAHYAAHFHHKTSWGIVVL